LIRKRTAADVGDILSDAHLGNAVERAQLHRERLGALTELRKRYAEHLQAWHVSEGSLFIQVKAQRRFQRGQRHLVEAESAHQRVLLDFLNPFLLAGEDAGLWAAEEFVAAE